MRRLERRLSLTGASAGLRTRWGAVLLVGVAFAGGCFTATALALTGPSPSPPPGPPPLIRTLLPIASGASQKIRLQAGFVPYKLGKPTTLFFSFEVQTPQGTIPQPLIGINIGLPRGLEATRSGLGLATCVPNTFYEGGIAGCPADSLIGKGTAIATVAIGPAEIREKVYLGLMSTPARPGHIELMYGAEGLTPVFSELTFRGEVIEANPPYGEVIATFIPPIETLPEAPYAAVVSMHSTIGPLGLTYYKQRHGHRVAYQPEGIILPNRCPRGGFPFAGVFTFLDQATKTIHLKVRCPSFAR